MREHRQVAHVREAPGTCWYVLMASGRITEEAHLTPRRMAPPGDEGASPSE